MTDQQMNRFGFWGKLEKPIVGLSPMDGVTDAPMRFIAKKYGQLDIIYTEFVSAEGLWRIKKRGEMDHKIWRDLIYSEIERPVIAQIFGSDPESFYEAAKIICELGFDGIDINMGCPSPGLEKRGGGAGLIRDKCNAKEVVEATRRGVKDFFSAPQSTQRSCSDPTALRLRGPLARDFGASELLEKKNIDLIPVSLKTRIGSDKPDQKWWELIASMQMPAVAMHGRTFKQLYSGEADWEVLTRAAEVIRESGALFLGNGDVKELKNSRNQELKIMTTLDQEIELTGKMDGVLIGRAAIGNPWILKRTQELKESRTQGGEIDEKLKVAVEHVEKYEELFPGQPIFPMRKHLAKYISGFEGAVEIRKKIMVIETVSEIKRILNEFLRVN